MTTQERITDFLSQKRLAVVGASRTPNSHSHKLFTNLWKRGYDAVPVNPNVTELDGLPCAASVQDIVPPVGAALIMTSAKNASSAVRHCVEAGIKRVWVPMTGGRNPLTRDDLALCRQNGIQLITGYCPYMFLPGSGFPHNFHGWVARLGKNYRVER